MIGMLAENFANGSPSCVRSRGLREALAFGVQHLNAAGIATARLDAEVLLGHVLNLSREQIMVSAADRVLDRAQIDRYQELLQLRFARAPLAYLTGRQEFWSLDFQVTPDVLVPRPDTERLVEIALMLTSSASVVRPLRILDIGTGSGAVAITLAKESPLAALWATDVSPAALEIARSNASRHGVAERISFFCADLFRPFAAGLDRFDLIASNPPYVRSADIADLAPEVSQWEPRLALDGGADGLDFYRRFAAELSSCLTPGGAIAVEIAADTGAQVSELFVGAGYTKVEIFQDYGGRDRVVVAKNSTA
ncbi:MAG: peptide chain release factor N(5)-glutamine methyltransferase [Candidatus Binatia bacterium]